MKMMSAAWSRNSGEKPWWYTVLQNLGDDSDSDDEDYPSSDSDSEPDEDRYSFGIIDIEHTDDSSESDWSEHSSDGEFINDDSDDQN